MIDEKSSHEDDCNDETMPGHGRTVTDTQNDNTFLSGSKGGVCTTQFLVVSTKIGVERGQRNLERKVVFDVLLKVFLIPFQAKHLQERRSTISMSVSRHLAC